MKKIFFILCIVFSLPAWAAAPIGSIVDQAGGVKISREKQVLSAQFKNPIYLRDIIETNQIGSVKILFIDDTLLTLKENSKTLISEYLFDGKKNKRQAVFEVFFGKVRSVVGKFFGKNQAVMVRTPTAVAGIRGTDVGTIVSGGNTIFYCFDGTIDTANTKSPHQTVDLSGGFGINIEGSRSPQIADRFAIPSDVLNQREQLFDIPLDKSMHHQSASKESAAENKQTDSDTKIYETKSEVLNPSTTTQEGGEVLPGGAGATADSDVTITFPGTGD